MFYASRSLRHSSLFAPPDVTLGNSLLLFDGHKVRRRIIAGLLKSLSPVLLWNTIVFACEPPLGVANLQVGARSRSPALTHGDTFKKPGDSSSRYTRDPHNQLAGPVSGGIMFLGECGV